METRIPGLKFTDSGRTYYLDQTTLDPRVEYECPVCTVFMREPKRLCSGVSTDTGNSWSHHICQNCLGTLTRAVCPMCRTSIDRRTVTTDLAMVANLKVHCPNQDCDATFPVSPTMTEAKQHLADECPKQLIECPAKCEVAQLKRETLAAHEQVCSQRYICECKQIFSGATSQEEITRHANENPEQHPHLWLIRFLSLPPKPRSQARGYQQMPVPVVAHTPHSRLCAGEPCIAIARDIYQSTANPQALFITVSIDAQGSVYRLIPYQDQPNGPLEEMQLFFEIEEALPPPEREYEIRVHSYTRSTSSTLKSVTITAYSGTPAQPFWKGTIRPVKGYNKPPPSMGNQFHTYLSNRACRPGDDGNYLFKIEI